jgi:hypothetical protein
VFIVSPFVKVELFKDCTGLIDAHNLKLLPKVNKACYAYMFAGCSSLEKAPELPATTLSESCYAYMFSGCTLLETSPELPA